MPNNIPDPQFLLSYLHALCSQLVHPTIYILVENAIYANVYRIILLK